MESLFNLDHQTAVITGGSGVLGRAMARALAQAGARVAVLSRRAEACEEVAANIRTQGGEAIGVACDVLDRAALEDAAVQVVAAFGPADILVNGAGGNQPLATVSPENPFFDLPASATDDVFGLNFKGTFQIGADMVIRADGRPLVRRRGNQQWRISPAMDPGECLCRGRV